MNRPLSDSARAYFAAMLMTALRSTNSDIVAALAALEVAVALHEPKAMAGFRLANQRHFSIIDTLFFRGRARRQRDDINQLVDQTLKIGDSAALNALDYFILVARHIDE